MMRLFMESVNLILGVNTKPDMLVTQGISGMAHHHLSVASKPGQSLCGAAVMQTPVRLAEWGHARDQDHPGKATFCNFCAQQGAQFLAPQTTRSPSLHQKAIA